MTYYVGGALQGGGAGVWNGVEEIATGGTIHDLALGANTGILRFTHADPITLTGIQGGSAGRTLMLVSEGAGGLTLNHEDTGSAAANRYSGHQTNPGLLLQTGTIELRHNGSRWLQVSRSW